MGRLRYMAGWERAVPVIPLLLMLGAAGVAAQDPYLVIRQQPLPADCNGDSSVNIFDLVLVGRAFGAVSGEGGYGPQMDLNGDGVIDIFDLVLVGRAFGEDSITFVGEQVCVEAYVGNVTDLYAYRFDVLHDPGMLEVVSVSEGPFLGSDGASTSWSPPTVNGTAGTITGLAATRAGAPEGVSGSGQLVLICFRAMAHGTSALYLQNVTLWDAGEVGMPVEVYPGGVLVDSIIPVHPTDQDWNEGTTGHVVSWSVASPDELGGPYTVYRNGSYWSSGTWINATAFNVGVDACVPGVWNFTVEAGDSSRTATDTVYVAVRAIEPNSNEPPDQVWTWGTTGHAIVWVVTDPGSHAGDYLVYRNGTCLNPSGDVWANGTDIAWGIDGLGAGVWNFTIVFWDGNCTEPYPADLVLVTVEKATPSLEMYLNGSPDDRDYFIWDVINLTGTVLPGDLLVVVEFTDGTDISAPLEGVSTAIVPAFQWGQGNYFVQAHTDGDANHTSADSARRRVRIVPWLQGDELSPSSYEGSLAGNEFPEAVTPADGGSGAGMTSPSGSPGTLGVSGAGTGADAPWGNPAWYLAVDEWERAAAPAERPAATTTSLELELHLQTS